MPAVRDCPKFYLLDYKSNVHFTPKELQLKVCNCLSLNSKKGKIIYPPTYIFSALI